MKRATIVYVVDPVAHEVLMAKKTREVGIGYWFGYGGKIEEGETPEECTAREFEKESGGVGIDSSKLEPMGEIDFYKGESQGPDQGDPLFRVMCFRLQGEKSHFSGVKTTSEMTSPTWFSVSSLPFSEMKPGDELFVPAVIKGIPVEG